MTMSAKIKLWNKNRDQIAEMNVPNGIKITDDSFEFLNNCWKIADEMALRLTALDDDDWGLEMVIRCDFAKPKRAGKNVKS